MATEAGSTFRLDSQKADLTVPDLSLDSAGDIKGVHGIGKMSVSRRTLPSCQSAWDVPVLCYGGPSKAPLYHEDSIISQNGAAPDATYDAFSIPTTTHRKAGRKVRGRSKPSSRTKTSKSKRIRSTHDEKPPDGGSTHAHPDGGFPGTSKPSFQRTGGGESNAMMECVAAGPRRVDNACDVRTLANSGVRVSTEANQSVSCSLDTISHVYLRQEAVYRIMNLDRLIISHGWNLGMLGTQILSGAVVLVARADGWRMRRIQSWCPDTMKIMLEDGIEVTPFDLCNGVLEGTRVHLDFAIKEYNYQMHNRKLKGFSGKEILATFYRLMLCSKAAKKIPSSKDQPRLISNLVQKLLSGPPSQFIDEFSPYLDELDLNSERSHAQSHESTINRMGERMQGMYCTWLANSCHIDTDTSPEISIENDLKLYSSAIRRFRFDSQFDASLRSDGEEPDIMYGLVPQPSEDRIQRGAEHSRGLRYVSPMLISRGKKRPKEAVQEFPKNGKVAKKRRGGYLKSKFVGGHLIGKNSTGGVEGGGADLGVRMLCPNGGISDVHDMHPQKLGQEYNTKKRNGNRDSCVESLAEILMDLEPPPSPTEPPSCSWD
ncbi:hypothetical protein BSKO_09558 [Bryopsis sp. KO-2023]|nr:hypothetical protein BSKO_09558 [Bryopsis sp. KO-2023]